LADSQSLLGDLKTGLIFGVESAALHLHGQADLIHGAFVLNRSLAWPGALLVITGE
jgi:hypothetical protein